MKYLSYILFALLFIAGCTSRPKYIPESELKDIITELMITDAVIEIGDYNKYLLDSVDFYQPVFDKYGYTQSDFMYTIRLLAARQSKPLANIFDEIFNDLANMQSEVKFTYDRKLHFEDVALLHYSDTIYKKDTTVIGSTGKLKFCINNPVKGYYQLRYTYQGLREYSIPLRRNVSILSFKDKSKKSVVNTTLVNRSFTPTQVAMEVKVPDSISYDSLVFRIEDPDYNNKFTLSKDTSRACNFRIFYSPVKEDADKAFFIWLTGMKAPSSHTFTFKDSLLNEWTYPQISKDSSAFWPISRR